MKDRITWEESVKEELVHYLNNFLSVSKTCNMGTVYSHPVVSEDNNEKQHDESKISSVELRIIFDFEKPIDADSVNFI